jgi:hypothetical protein
LKRRPPKKRARYEQDDDFDISDGKNGDDDFVPSRSRYVYEYYLFLFFFKKNFSFNLELLMVIVEQ